MLPQVFKATVLSLKQTCFDHLEICQIKSMNAYFEMFSTSLPKACFIWAGSVRELK